MKSFFGFPLFFVSVLSLAACAAETSAPTAETATEPTGPGTGPDDQPPAKPVAFTTAEVQKLFEGTCAPCHTQGEAGSLSLAGNFTARTVEVPSKQLPSMKLVAKGDRSRSYLFLKVLGTHEAAGGSGVKMPKNAAALPAADVEKLGAWIDAL